MLSTSALVTNLPDVSPWETLGISEASNVQTSEIDHAWSALKSKGDDTAAARQAWKLLRDPLYRGAYSQYPSIRHMEQAGFFDDMLDIGWDQAAWGDTGILVTPVEKLRARLQSHEGPATVLLTTGSFSPLHRGHLRMMERAKASLDAAGVFVAGGYFSLSHDRYVSRKYGGAAALSAQHRLQICHLAVADSDWLCVDPWEAEIAPVPLNFSDVIKRLECYLARHLPNHPLSVTYVFGSDNAGFAMAFSASGQCVCIERHPLDEAQRMLLEATHAARPASVYVAEDKALIGFSSTAVRNGQFEQMVPSSRPLYEAYRMGRQGCGSRIYLVRDDLAWASRRWAPKPEALEAFQAGLTGLLSQAFRDVQYPDTPRSMQVVSLPQEAQQRYVDSLHKQGVRTLSLDACTNATASLRLSREFGLSDGQVYSRRFLPSPGHADLANQLRGIPPGTYVAIEDDIVSGRTLEFIRNSLAPDVTLDRVVELSEWSYRSIFGHAAEYQFFDIVDARDFLLGAQASGLAVRMPNGDEARVPYIWPYVNLVSRAKLPPSSIHAFSESVLELNLLFFVAHPTVCVRDVDSGMKAFLRYLGFNEDAPMQHVVRAQMECMALAHNAK